MRFLFFSMDLLYASYVNGDMETSIVLEDTFNFFFPASFGGLFGANVATS